MSDKELLELAAKAAGLTIRDWWEKYPSEWWAELEVGRQRNYPPTVWNPLADNGEALRLAVSLQISVGYSDLAGTASASWDGGSVDEYGPGDSFAAARRAIVRAAAEMGKV